MNKNKLIISLATLPVVTGAFVASAVLNPAAATYECDAEKDLQGTVTRNEATVTNHSTNEKCAYDATLAVYDSPKEPETTGWIEAQTLIGSKTINVKAGETVTIKVEGTGPSCWNQSDLIRGTGVITPPVYRTAMDTDVYKVKENECKTTTTTTTTNNNESPKGGSSSTPTSVTASQLAPTGDSIVVLSFLLAGFATLFAGLFLRKAGK